MDSEKTVLDPVFVVNGRKRGLPWILHALEDGRRLQFDHLRPHQEHAWHLFLVQTAAMLGPTDDWDALLRTEGEIWDVHPEPGECGFFQPAGRIEDGYKKQTYLEKEDIPGISTNHRAKAHLPSALDYWLYALIAAQTISRHYTHHRQSIRTSDGYGDRPYVSKVRGLSWPERFHSDVSLARSMHGDKEGTRFLWVELEKTDFFGDESRISFSDCHPLVVDSCRPYRMQDGILYYKAGWPNEPLETDIGDLHDRLDDPWLPIDTTDDHTTKRTQRSGFTYRVVQKYLAGGDIKTPSLQREFGVDCYFIAQTIAGGKGASQGIHHRVVKLPADLSDDLFPSGDTFATRSEQYVAVASTVKKRLLTFPLVALFGRTNDDNSDVALIERMMKDENLNVTPRYSEYLNRYESRVDREFFPHLFDHAEEETGVERWKNRLCEAAEELFEEALASCTSWQRKAEADTLFRSRIHTLRSHELEASGVPN
jgi:CRISPR system Cascade subunit CasA